MFLEVEAAGYGVRSKNKEWIRSELNSFGLVQWMVSFILQGKHWVYYMGKYLEHTLNIFNLKAFSF